MGSKSLTIGDDSVKGVSLNPGVTRFMMSHQAGRSIKGVDWGEGIPQGSGGGGSVYYVTSV